MTSPDGSAVRGNLGCPGPEIWVNPGISHQPGCLVSGSGFIIRRTISKTIWCSPASESGLFVFCVLSFVNFGFFVSSFGFVKIFCFVSSFGFGYWLEFRPSLMPTSLIFDWITRCLSNNAFEHIAELKLIPICVFIFIKIIKKFNLIIIIQKNKYF